jgi:hypothetical protein
MATTIRENETTTKMAVATIAVPGDTSVGSGTDMAVSGGMATTAPSLLSPEEEAATYRFLENVNKWRAANSLSKVPLRMVRAMLPLIVPTI